MKVGTMDGRPHFFLDKLIVVSVPPSMSVGEGSDTQLGR